jgi:fluoroquinolone transport system permease protein
VVLLAGFDFRILPLVAGVALASVLCCLIGFVLIARYDSINEYIFPSVFYNALLQLPMVDYLGLWRSDLFYLHPLQGSLLLMRAAFSPVPGWQWIYAGAYGLACVALAGYIGKRAFDRFVVAREGVR